ncbi:DUF418 domain-containing protein [Actinomadura kijaniata]|uniref:DUF418 domain-containing protein n=1 Tax=Actinomadura kijaniata TaxID=46161 RepID=UPI003F1B7C8F
MTAAPSRRIAEVDAVRGLALCGILVVNVVGMAGMPPGSGAAPALYETALHQRFFPIFSFLFGVGSALFLRSAARHTDHPRVLLLARLGFLVFIGLAHRTLQPREVLLPYAVVGIAVLLPFSLLPRWAALGAGTVLTGAGLVAFHGGSALIPGLFLLGLAAARYGLVDALERRPRRTAAAFGTSALLALAAGGAQLLTGARPGGSWLPAAAGLVTGAAYVTGLLLLLRTRAAPPLLAVLVPLGRAALTNYLTATVLIVVVLRVVPLDDAPHYDRVLVLSVAILAVQTAVCRWWLGRFRYGPAEWAWRCLTWWKPLPNATGSAGRTSA